MGSTENTLPLMEASAPYRPYLIAGGFFLLLLMAAQFQVFQTYLGFTRPQEVAAIILLTTAYLWISELVPLYVTSFIVVALQLTWLLPVLKAHDIAIKQQDFLSPFFSNIILLFLGGFVLSALLHRYRIDERMAQWILGKTGSKPSHIIAGIMIVSAVLSMWMSNTATTAMMIAIILPIVAKIPDTNPFSKALMLSVPFACNLGGLGTPIGTPPNAIALTYIKNIGISLSFAEWMLCAVPFVILFLGVLWKLLLVLYPPGDLEIAIPEKTKGKLKTKHWIVIGIFAITCIGWFTTKYHGLSTGTVSLFPLVVAFGARMLQVEDFRNLSWDVLFMVGGGLTLGVGLRVSGFTEAVVGFIPDEMGFAWLLILFAIIAGLMTTFMSNTATANLLIPLAASLDGPAAILMVTIAMMCSTAMALPVSTPPNAIAFGSGLLEAKDMILPGVILMLIFGVLILAFGPMYWPLLGV